MSLPKDLEAAVAELGDANNAFIALLGESSGESMDHGQLVAFKRVGALTYRVIGLATRWRTPTPPNEAA